MMFLWQPQMIRFMHDASEYGTYHRTIASHILENCCAQPSVCDAGCGLGYLSLALSPYSSSVTAVDINSDVLEMLRQNATDRRVENIKTICSEIESIPEQLQFDAMVFCFFGNTETVLKAAKKHCTGKTFVVKKRLLPGESPELLRSAPDFEEVLLDKGIPFRREFIDTRLDQPFKTLEDALEFYNTYKPKEPYKSMTEEEYINKLTQSASGEYPLVFPINKNLVMTIIESKDIE